MIAAPPFSGEQELSIQKGWDPESKEYPERLPRGTCIEVLEMRELESGEKRARVVMMDDDEPLGWTTMVSEDGALLVRPLISSRIFVLVQPLLVRRAFELTSEKVGLLPVGSRIHIVKRSRTSAGAHRVNFVFVGRRKVVGWLTAKTEKGVLTVRMVGADGVDPLPLASLDPKCLDRSPSPSRPGSARDEDGSPTTYMSAYSSAHWPGFQNSLGISPRSPPRTPRTPRTPRSNNATPRVDTGRRPSNGAIDISAEGKTADAPVKKNLWQSKLGSLMMAVKMAPPQARASAPAQAQQSAAADPEPAEPRPPKNMPLLTAAQLTEKVKEFTEKIAWEEAKIGSQEKALSVRLGEELVAQQIKVPELVQKWAKRGEEPISKMEFRQHVRKMIDKTDVKDIDALFDELDDDHGGSLDVPELKAALKKLQKAAEISARKTAAVREQVVLLQSRLEAANHALSLTSELERSKTALEMKKSGDTVPLRERLGMRVNERGIKVNELVAKWGNKTGEVPKPEFRKHVAALLNIKPNAFAELAEIDELFEALDEDGGGTLDQREIKHALHDFFAAAKSAQETTERFAKMAKEVGRKAREAQVELRQLLDEDKRAAEAAEEQREREVSEKAKAAEAAATAKAAAAAEKVAAEAAKKAEFEARIAARRGGSGSPTKGDDGRASPPPP